jgi:molybdenum cofactor biosynthesis enzyme MoaA
MMRFPLRLTADLALARFASRVCPIQFLDAAEILHRESNHPVSHEKIREINSSRSPVVWIGGSEPLHHAGISHLVRAITRTGHVVFLETDGTLLRRRIHEFQPVSRLFLTVRLESGAQPSASRRARTSAFELAVEGIRAARLSGFLICAHARVHEETELAALTELVEFARSLDVDGIVISPANEGSNSANRDAAALRIKTDETRKLIGSQWWESFSRMVEPVLITASLGRAQRSEETGARREQEAHANEEGARVG